MRIRALSIFSGAAIAAASAFAQTNAKPGAVDWPFYRGDAAMSGVAETRLPAKPELLWSFKTGGPIKSSPVISQGRVFIGSDDGNLYELNAATGELRAKFNLGKPISASPAIGEGVLVIGTEGNDGRVVCFGGVQDVAISDSQIDGTTDDKSKTGDPRTHESSEPGSQRRANQTQAVEQTR